MILCCGEALIDMLPRALKEGGEGFLPAVGGALFNTAIGLGRLQEDVGFFSALSEDMFGQQLVEALQASGVNTELCPRNMQPTTLAFVKLTDGQASYSFFDENSAGRSLTVDELPSLDANIKALHFGGISLISEPGGLAYETLMAQNTDRVLSIDPNIRCSFITDENAHRERIQRMISMADIVKVSDEDLAWIEPAKERDDVIATWLAGTTSVVLITEGADGATAFTSEGSIHQNVFKVDVVDTIGAGDTFNSGFLSGLRQSDLLSKKALAEASLPDLAPALERAALVSARTVAKAGANPPWLNEL